MMQWISNGVYQFQKHCDRLMAKSFDKIWLFFGITPNVLTIARFIGTAILWALFLTETNASDFWNYSILALFIITALTDLWDGALARNTNQVTHIGTLLDPLADKLLIGSVLYFLAATLAHWTLYMIIFLEAMMIVLNIIFYMVWESKIKGANAYGKLKMGLEVVFVAMLLLGVYQQSPDIITAGYYIGGGAVFFAIISMLKGIQDSASAL